MSDGTQTTQVCRRCGTKRGSSALLWTCSGCGTAHLFTPDARAASDDDLFQAYMRLEDMLATLREWRDSRAEQATLLSLWRVVRAEQDKRAGLEPEPTPVESTEPTPAPAREPEQMDLFGSLVPSLQSTADAARCATMPDVASKAASIDLWDALERVQLGLARRADAEVSIPPEPVPAPEPPRTPYEAGLIAAERAQRMDDFARAATREAFKRPGKEHRWRKPVDPKARALRTEQPLLLPSRLTDDGLVAWIVRAEALGDKDLRARLLVEAARRAEPCSTKKAPKRLRIKSR